MITSKWVMKKIFLQSELQTVLLLGERKKKTRKKIKKMKEQVRNKGLQRKKRNKRKLRNLLTLF